MASGIDVDELLEDSTRFLSVPTIPFETPIVALLESCLRWQSDGMPFVIKGIPLDGLESPFLRTDGWERLPWYLGERLTEEKTDDNSVLTYTCPPEWSGWLHTSYLVPNYLRPQGPSDLFPKHVNTMSCQSGIHGNATRFEDSHHGTSDHYLLCFQKPDAHVVWFITAAADSQRVFDHFQSVQTTSLHQLDREHLSDLPFDVYLFKQERGDLVVLPPRSYRQRLFEGNTATFHWSTMTIEGLQHAVFYDLYKRQRLCWPARYHIKQLAYDAMRSRFAQLKASETALTRSTAVEMRKLLELVDEILGAEAYANDGEIPNFGDPATTTLSCAFCGGEVFQKGFCCKNECTREGTKLTPANAISICPTCYVDGRTCLCGKMAPFRLLPMERMVTSRNEVAVWLRSHSRDLLLSDDSEDDTDTDCHDIIELDSDNLADGTFLAALLLCLARDNNSGAKRTCTIRKGQPSHQVDGYALLNCKNCHASRCYRHILSTLNIHSSQAVLVYYTTESSSEAWHKHHLDLKHDYLESYPQLLSSMLTGSYHPLKHRLAYFALHFPGADPVSGNTMRGFYDVDGTVHNTSTSSRAKKRNSAVPPGGLADAGSSRDARASAPERPSTIGSSGSGRELKRKRSRGSTSDNEDKTGESYSDVVQPKRPRVRGRVEGNQGNRPLLQTEHRILEAPPTTKPPSTAGKQERPGPKSRRILQILSSSPGPEGDEQSTHSPGKALKSFDPETDLGFPKPDTTDGKKLVSGWDTLVSSFGLSASNLNTGYRSKSSNLQGDHGTRRPYLLIAQEKDEDRRKPHLNLASLAPPRKVGRTAQETHGIAGTSGRISSPLPPEAQEQRARSRSRNFVHPDLRRASSSSHLVPNPPRSVSLGSHGERVLERGLRKRPSEMALSEDSVSRENLLFYLDRMEAPDDEAEEDFTGTYKNRRSSK